MNDTPENKKLKKFLLIGGAIAGYVIISIILVVVLINQKRYSAENLVLTVQGKENTTLTIGFQNESLLDVREIRGKISVYTTDHTLLHTFDCNLKGDFASRVESTITVNVENGEENLDFYYADAEDLEITFDLGCVIYGNDVQKTYREDPMVILALSPDADGISTVEANYQQAVALYDAAQYAEAASMFQVLGDYKDSADYYQQCRSSLENIALENQYQQGLSYMDQERYADAIAVFNGIPAYKDSTAKVELIFSTVNSKARELEETGDYPGAQALLAQLGYNDNNNELYKAYSHAISGNFVAAVQCGLTVVVFPEGTEEIPEEYFKDPNHRLGLQKVVIPDSVAEIGASAFEGCISLTSVTFPEGLRSIGDRAFKGCSKLTQLDFLGTLQTVGDSAFYYCSALTQVILPPSVEYLGDGAFSYCTGVQTVCIPGSVKNVNSTAFDGCTALTDLTLEEGVEVIGSYAFGDCSALTVVKLPDSLLEIAENAFYQCSALTELTVPAKVRKIGAYAFYNCTALQQVCFENPTGWLRLSLAVDVSDPQQNAKELVMRGSTMTRN